MTAEDRAGEAAVAGAAARGVAILGVRTLLLQVATIGATVALARLLAPRDYGLFAVGLAVQQLTRAGIDLGLPVPLVRRKAPPTLEELRALTGFVLLVGVAIAGLAALVAFGVMPLVWERRAVLDVVAVMCLATPFYAARTASMVRLERGLAFGRIALVETTEALGFYAFAVPAAALGLGAYSLAGGTAVAIASSAAVALLVAPWPFGVSLRFRLLRPLARLGAGAGLIYPVQLVREMGFVSVLTAIGGASLTGFYGFAQRIFSIPTALLIALQRVSLPALSQVETGARRDERTAQAIAVSGVVLGLPMALLVGAVDPLLAVAFGDRWVPAGDVVRGAALGTALASTAGVMLVNYFLANDRSRPPLESALAALVVSLGASAVLVPWLEETGAGIALSCALVAMTGFAYARAPLAVRRSLPSLAIAIAVAAAAAVAATLAAPGQGVADLAIAVAVAGAVWIAGSMAFNRAQLAILLRLARAFRGRAAPVAG